MNPTRDQIESKLRELLATYAVKNCAIKDATRLVEDLGCDSLDAVEIVMDLEEEFGVEITDDAAMFEKCKTFKDAIDVLTEALK